MKFILKTEVFQNSIIATLINTSFRNWDISSIRKSIDTRYGSSVTRSQCFFRGLLTNSAGEFIDHVCLNTDISLYDKLYGENYAVPCWFKTSFLNLKIHHRDMLDITLKRYL